MLSWNVKIENWNEKRIEDYDVLKYRIDIIKKLKKKCNTKEEFAEELKKDIQWQYWSRCEYELHICKTYSEKIILTPILRGDMFLLDVTDDNTFDWNGFYEYLITKRTIYGGYIKFDIFDQIMWRWNEFVDYCWYTRLPYERKNSKFEK